MANLLARFAENTFWMARYVERADNLARIVDINNTFAQSDRGEHEWLPIVQLYRDEELFFEHHDEATADAVLSFYLLDRENPTSLVATVHEARENARSLRHLISTETWTQLNMFHNRLQALRPRDLTLTKLSSLCAEIKEACQLHTGIIEGTGYRDQNWYVYQIGKYLERADQTTRLLDINYHRLLPSSADVGTQIDASRWNAVLRSVAGYHAFRRAHPRGMAPATVAGFLLSDRSFQRSVAMCINQVDELLKGLSSLVEMKDVVLPRERTAALGVTVSEVDIGDVIVVGLHEFLDRVQEDLIALTDELGDLLFGYRYERGTAP